jgi:hypothetical protein
MFAGVAAGFSPLTPRRHATALSGRAGAGALRSISAVYNEAPSAAPRTGWMISSELRAKNQVYLQSADSIPLKIALSQTS